MNTLELMKTEIPAGNKRRKLLDMSLSETVRVTDMLRKMLSFSKPDQEERAPVDINTILDEILLLHEKQLWEHSIKVVHHFAEGLGWGDGTGMGLRDTPLPQEEEMEGPFESLASLDLAESATVVGFAPGFDVLRWSAGFFRVYLPQLYPYLFGAARNGLALIWKIVLVVELLGRMMLMLVALSEFISAIEVSDHVGQSLTEIGGVVRSAGDTVIQVFATGRGIDWAAFLW